MKILSIETSCDETALAVLEASREEDIQVLSTALYSQVDIHKEYGGVFPAMAKRSHAKNLVPLLSKIADRLDWEKGGAVEKKAEILHILEREPDLGEQFVDFLKEYKKPEIDMIAVTRGPGLEPALWVGINFAKALSLAWDIPLIPVDHMEGHIVSVLGDEVEVHFPALALLISGGHTELVVVRNWGDYEVVGKTLDDAVGEAYDKVARMLDLPYPGGPEISKLAQKGRDRGIEGKVELPRPVIHTKDFNFSLSGLKTAVLYQVEGKELSEEDKVEIATEFEQAIVDVLNKKTGRALEEFDIQTLVVGGGVIANQYIRENLQKVGDDRGIPVLFPTTELSTDNAVMIGIAGYLKSHREKPVVNPEIVAEGKLSLG